MDVSERVFIQAAFAAQSPGRESANPYIYASDFQDEASKESSHRSSRAEKSDTGIKLCVQLLSSLVWRRPVHITKLCV